MALFADAPLVSVPINLPSHCPSVALNVVGDTLVLAQQFRRLLRRQGLVAPEMLMTTPMASSPSSS
ncbi:hypothetical protein U1Q18_036988, partial [Sarracenia purpurea var. burkii]